MSTKMTNAAARRRQRRRRQVTLPITIILVVVVSLLSTQLWSSRTTALVTAGYKSRLTKTNHGNSNKSNGLFEEHQQQQQQQQQQRRKKKIIRTAPDQRWEEMKGNYVLMPPPQQSLEGQNEKQQLRPPRAILHFLGGAFVGAAPHVSYRYMLERLANEGYLIVATPYDMSFDHLEMCATVHDRFEAVLPDLKRQYGSSLFQQLPTVAIGHSCGSLLHLLMSTSLYTTGKQNKKQTKVPVANVLMSFNNKPVADSIPYFEELVAPIAQSYYNSQNKSTNNPARRKLNFIRLAHEARAASDVGLLLRGMEKAEAHAGRDVDFLLYEMKRAAHLLKPPAISQRRRQQGKELLPLKSPSSLPPSIFTKAAKSGLSAALRPAKRTLQTMTLLNQVVDGMDQIPQLLQQIANGTNDFALAPNLVREYISNGGSASPSSSSSYVVPKTLLLQYQDDGIDESEEMEQLLLKQTKTKGPASVKDQDQQQDTTSSIIQRRILQGGHGAPLLAPPLHVATSAEKRWGNVKAKEKLGYVPADATVSELTKWLDSAIF